MKRRELITLLDAPYRDALDFLRGVKVLALRATGPEAMHEDMK
jgi:hypothetical protein